MRKTEKMFDPDIFCYCELLDGKVFKKVKCPYFEDGVGDLLKAFVNKD